MLFKRVCYGRVIYFIIFCEI